MLERKHRANVTKPVAPGPTRHEKGRPMTVRQVAGKTVLRRTSLSPPFSRLGLLCRDAQPPGTLFQLLELHDNLRCLTHCILAGPFPGGLLVPTAVGLVDVRNFRHKGVIRVGICEQGADGQKHLRAYPGKGQLGRKQARYVGPFDKPTFAWHTSACFIGFIQVRTVNVRM